MQTNIRLNPEIIIVNAGGKCGYEIWQGDSFLHKTLAKGFATQGQAIMWVVDNGFATVERS